jgi:tetratricopeptide (TPR) repeat protein
MGRLEQAELCLEGLIALYPYDKRFWRALGIIQQRQYAWEDANESLGCALLIDPEDTYSRCLLGETLLYLGQKEAARVALEKTKNSNKPYVQKRSVDLLKIIAKLGAIEPMPSSAAKVAENEITQTTTFMLDADTPLPLEESLFDDEPTRTQVSTDAQEATQTQMTTNISKETTRIFVAQTDESTNTDDPERTKTITYHANQDVTAAKQSFEHTAIVKRRYGHAFIEKDEDHG